MKRKKAIFSVVAILCAIGIAGGIWGWMAYHKARPTLDSVKADVQINAAKLYNDFSTNEQNADKLYLNKVVEVSGVVASVQQDSSSASVQLTAGDGAMGGINCDMRSTENLPKKGDSVHIKGRCTGYLMDVSLVDAVNISK
ncbi:hypothetical protein A9P82_03395 [Arachidicoccus ginsenosidimutans]|uniref:OB-fold protein n=1 Tax=Arachidicoccus sp. BS20 TaxID=1850526 RepID=UPI0007F10EF1|nr:hypothetical protein [Arachidicoccus sp. BS20]ANI88430.1 hypothetical protein A9P82_03395 [Arachidicoccus sp. BS20]